MNGIHYLRGKSAKDAYIDLLEGSKSPKRKTEIDHSFPSRQSLKKVKQKTIERSDLLFIDNSPRPRASVLIIDDDVDALLPIDQMLNQFGCNTCYSLESKDASKKISSGKIDLIILDWWMDKDTGAEIIEKALKAIEKFDDLKRRIKEKGPKIITYSSQNFEEILLPKNPYFAHVDHWAKPIKYQEIAIRASAILREIGY